MEKSSLITFIEKYRDSKLSDRTLRKFWLKEVEKDDFDKNEWETYCWFLQHRKSYCQSIVK